MTDPRQIIDFAADEDAKGVREAMYASLYDRVMNAIEAKKQEVGATLVGGMPLATEEVQQDEETLDEKWAKEEKEGHEDKDEDEKMCKDIAKKEVKGHEKRMHKEEEELEEDLPGAVNKVTKFVGKTMDTVGAVGKLGGTIAGKTLGGVSQTAGAIRQTPAAASAACAARRPSPLPAARPAADAVADPHRVPRDGDRPGLLGVVDEVPLCVQVGLVADDLDRVFVGADGAV